MKTVTLPKGMHYIGDELRLIIDPMTREKRTKPFAVAIDIHKDELYLVDRVTGAMMAYKPADVHQYQKRKG